MGAQHERSRRDLDHQYNHPSFNSAHVVGIVEEIGSPTETPQLLTIVNSTMGFADILNQQNFTFMKNTQQLICQGIKALDMSQENGTCLLIEAASTCLVSIPAPGIDIGKYWIESCLQN